MIAEIYFSDKAYENKSNHRALQRYKRHIEPIFGKRDIFNIAKNEILNFRNSFIDTHAPKTINGIIQLLTAIVNYNIKTKDLKVINPCTGIPMSTAELN